MKRRLPGLQDMYKRIKWVESELETEKITGGFDYV